MPSKPNRQTYTLHPIGEIRNTPEGAWIDVDSAFADGLLGLEQFSHLWIFYWLHENDTPEQRKRLQVHPRNNPENPLTGVFATHSPVRPNLIALTRCQVLKRENTRLVLDRIDARDRSPLIDIKCYVPEENQGVKTADWIDTPR